MRETDDIEREGESVEGGIRELIARNISSCLCAECVCGSAGCPRHYCSLYCAPLKSLPVSHTLTPSWPSLPPPVRTDSALQKFAANFFMI